METPKLEKIQKLLTNYEKKIIELQNCIDVYCLKKEFGEALILSERQTTLRSCISDLKAILYTY